MRRPRAGQLALAALVLSACLPPAWGAHALLHPWRKPSPGRTSLPHQDLAFRGTGGVLLKGWRSAPARIAQGCVGYYKSSLYK